jgi:hypothetical protein
MGKVRYIPAMVFTLGMFLSVAVAADERAEYRQGITAFKKSDYAQALQYFQRAEKQGMKSVSLFYNLGATHYRLGNYDASIHYFTSIRTDAEWGALAEYNLGLVAERQNIPGRAERHYRKAYNQTDSEQVKKLARARLNALSGASATTGTDNWTIYLSGAVGRDDNPALVEDTQLPPASGADTFLETIGNVSGYLHGGYDDGVRLSASIYNRSYSDMSEFGIAGIDVGIFLDDESNNWRLVRGVRANSYWIDGTQYSTGGSLLLQATQRAQGVSLDIKNDLAFIKGGSAFEYISGIRNRFNLDLFQRQSAGEWRIGYKNEINDRDDLTTADDQFFSYSPIRHSVYGQVRRHLSDQWTLRTRLEFRNSQYRDDNREVDSETGVITEKGRKEDRLDASVLIRYSVNNTFSTFAEYRYTDNNTNFDRFSYQSNQVMLGVDAIF